MIEQINDTSKKKKKYKMYDKCHLLYPLIERDNRMDEWILILNTKIRDF